MRTFIRTYFLAFLSVFLTQSLIGGFSYGYIFGSPLILFVLGLALVQFFILPLLKILALPNKGLGGLLLRSLLVGLVMYFSTSSLNGFSVVETVLPEISILDLHLPSKALNPIESLVASALSYSIINSLVSWVCIGKK